jgi:hypothetical protein
MKFEVQIATDNAAFEEGCGYEVARILRELADRVEESELRNGDLLRLRDVNGNRVGYATLAEGSP